MSLPPDGRPASTVASRHEADCSASDGWYTGCAASGTPMSTTKPSPKPATLADLDALPPGIVGEIIEGVLYTMTKPRMPHQRTTRMIGGGVGDPFDDGRGGPG